MEDSDTSVEGFDPNNCRWIRVNKKKRNMKSKSDKSALFDKIGAKRNGDSSTESGRAGINGDKAFQCHSATVKKKDLICKGGAEVCGLSISMTDCIRCDGCMQWFHPKCQEISVEAFSAI